MVSAVAVRGSYAYAAVGPRLEVLDVSSPAAPRLVGHSAPLPDLVRAVGVSGDDAYIDVSDPAQPTLVTSRSLPGGILGLAQAGNYTYVAGSGGLFILRLSGTKPAPSIPNLSAMKLASRDGVFPGEALAYLIFLDNRGAAGISLAITDTIPANTSYIPGTLSGGAVYSDTINSILWSGTVPPGLSSLPSQFFSFRVKVGAAARNVITNTLLMSDASTTVASGVETVVWKRTFAPVLLKGTAAW